MRGVMWAKLCRGVFRLGGIVASCDCGMQESRRSELSNNCARVSGIFLRRFGRFSWGESMAWRDNW